MNDYALIAERVGKVCALYGLDLVATSDCQRRAAQYYENGNPYEEAIQFGGYLAKWRHNWAVNAELKRELEP